MQSLPRRGRPLGASLMRSVGKLCDHRGAVTFRSYPGLDHDPTMEQSTPDQLAWIRERFEGRPAGSNCR